MDLITLTGLVQVILSYGMGVESTAILLRWILEPEICPCALSDLLVITSQVGDEFRDTGQLVETYILPLLRAHGIRFVQVARSGHLEEEGITILADTRSPDKLFLDGVYKLSNEMTVNGTVPQFSGVHRCALKFKAWVIEQWLSRYFVPSSSSSTSANDSNTTTAIVKHAIGYNADEISRVKNSEYAFARRDSEAEDETDTCTMRVAFGFNAEETSRIENANEYDGLRGRLGSSSKSLVSSMLDEFVDAGPATLPAERTAFKREAFYPLLEWGWNRQKCLDYIYDKLGVIWLKSACTFCPFAKNKQNMKELMRRHMAHTEQVADALVMEHLSLAMNPRGTLYSGASLIQITTSHGNTNALAEYEKKLACSEWALYRVRRIYERGKNGHGQPDPAKKGQVKRAVERLDVFPDRASALFALHQAAKNIHAEIVEMLNIPYLYVERCAESYPTREEYFTIAPAIVETKARYGIEWFDAIWCARQQNLFAA